MMYSNIGLSFHETVPLKQSVPQIIEIPFKGKVNEIYTNFFIKRVQYLVTHTGIVNTFTAKILCSIWLSLETSPSRIPISLHGSKIFFCKREKKEGTFSAGHGMTAKYNWEIFCRPSPGEFVWPLSWASTSHWKSRKTFTSDWISPQRPYLEKGD